MSKSAIILGCGMVGATMARDLAGDKGFDVTVADASADSLRKLQDDKNIAAVQVDLSNPEMLRGVIESRDIVLGALPSRIGLSALRTVIECGKPYSDISFMPEDALELDELAKEHGVTAVVDCGVSPGLSNMIVGYAFTQLDRVDNATIYVGGLPKVRSWPFQYKAPFAPSDVIEEYTRPARFIENGRLVTRSALSEPELIEFPNVGTLEAFNTDGLRSLLATVKIENMKEKTLRYPGHIDLMRALRETGFLSKEKIEIDGVSVRPLDVTSALLFPKWKLDESEEEFTVLRVEAEGGKGGRRVRLTYDLYDQYDKATSTTSMARTTAFPAAIVARMLADGRISKPGVLAPEIIAQDDRIFESIVSELRKRGVVLNSNLIEL